MTRTHGRKIKLCCGCDGDCFYFSSINTLSFQGLLSVFWMNIVFACSEAGLMLFFLLVLETFFVMETFFAILVTSAFFALETFALKWEFFEVL